MSSVTDASSQQQSRRPDDSVARHRIRTSLDESLLVEAAAGTGKTTVLVDRLVAILRAGATTIDRIVAVTFTRKAAGELKLRLRQELDTARSATSDRDERSHLEDALARLEEAHVGTIHSFCAEILRERPVEARIDPAFEEVDEEASAQLYDRAFQGWIERKLDEVPSGLRRALSRLARGRSFDNSTPVDRLREAGRSLVDWRDFTASWERRPFEREAAIDTLLEGVDELSELCGKCRNRHDYLRRALEPAADLSTWVRRTETVADRDYDELEAQLVDLYFQLHRNRNWKGRGRWFAAGIEREQALKIRDAVLGALEAFKHQADADLAALLHTELREVIVDYEELKRRAGQLDFLDLLLRTRDLIHSDELIRRELQERFTHLFVDEFQDTDPLQAEILLLLAADDPAQTEWRRVRPRAGKLFLVGDPKQSIYRFRRADVLLYQDVKRQLTERGAVAMVQMQRSYRSVSALQHAVNAAFSHHMTGDLESGQPDYIPLQPFRETPGDQPHIVVVPAPAPFGYSRITKTKIEACLPDTTAAFVAWLLHDSGWTVQDPDDRHRRVAIAPRHIALLFRRFMSWGSDVTHGYVGALEARAIPHVLVGGRSFHQREEVETLRAALTAVEWPDDRLAVYSTLRGDLFAIPDNLLLRYRVQGWNLHPFSVRPYARQAGDDVAGFQPICEALDLLAELHRQRNYVPITDTIYRLLETTRAHAGFALRPAGHQVLANIERVCDLARSFELRGGLSFRGFVEHLDAESERPRSSYSPVLEEGADGVRLMTAHAAKGLEFPVVVLADLTANIARPEPSLYLDASRHLSASKLLGLSPWELRDHSGLEHARDQAEGVRLAYVAATRAKDLLVVPGVGTEPWEGGWLSPLNPVIYPPKDSYRTSRPAPGCPPFQGSNTVLESPQTMAGPLHESVRPGLHQPMAGDHQVVWWDPSQLELGVERDFGLRQEEILGDADAAATAGGIARHREWRHERERTLAAGSRLRFEVAIVTELEDLPPGDEPTVTIEQVPRSEGRPSGKRFGSLVHTMLRDADFEADAKTLQALAEMHGRMLDTTSEEISAAASCVGQTLAHPLMRRAAGAERRHRETPFLVDRGDGTLVEGTLDLAFAEGDRWIVVDFKTDLDLTAHEEAYRRQVAWYAYALHTLTKQSVQGVLLAV
ncbi:MAG: UvrD-helicase domain-containing protein [Acidobacteriota bacterium]